MTAFDAEEFLRLGERVAQREPNEAGYRTGTNRAYYACHSIGIEAVTKKGWYVPKNGAPDHSGLCRTLEQHDPLINPMSDKMWALLAMREHADYHIDPALSDPNKKCAYCAAAAVQTWARARDIANDLFPRLKSIKPTGK